MAALFKVINIVSGNTIEVVGWKWGDYSGKQVQINGYNIDSSSNDFARNKLEILLKGKEVELRAPMTAEKRNGDENDLIMCTVMLNDIDVSKYFPELTTT